VQHYVMRPTGCVVVEVAGDDLLQPFPLLGNRLVHLVVKIEQTPCGSIRKMAES